MFRFSLFVLCFCLVSSVFADVPAVGQQTPPAAKEKFVSHWDTKNALVIPFEYDLAKNTSPAIWLRVNGGKPRLFVVDTGFTFPFILSSNAAGEMKLDTVPTPASFDGLKFSAVKAAQIALYFPATKTTAAKDVTLPPVAVHLVAGPGQPAANNLLLENPLFVTDGLNELTAEAGKSYSAPIAGLIGSGFLHSAYGAAQFDFVRRELTLYPKVDSRLRIRGAATLPISVKSDCYLFSVPLDSGKTQEILIDTGNGGAAVLPTALAEDFNTLDAGPSSETRLRFGGRMEALDCLIPKLRVGSLTETDVLAHTIASKEMLQMGDGTPFVGINFLSRFRVTLDYAHNELTLQRASDYKKHLRLPAGSLGYGYDYDGYATITNLTVNEGSREAKAGLRNGDQLIAVNGVAITEKTARVYDSLLPQCKGDRVALLVQHKNGRKQTVYITMPGLYDDLRSDPVKTIGLNLTPAPSDYFIVDDIDADSLAGKAGFQQGDILLAVDGLPVYNSNKVVIMPVNFLRPGQSVTYTVRRKGEDKLLAIVVGYRIHK